MSQQDPKIIGDATMNNLIDEITQGKRKFPFNEEVVTIDNIINASGNVK